MSGIEGISAILGVTAFAGEVIKATAKSYDLVKRYQDSEPRARQLLNEIQATSELLANVQRQLSNADAIQSVHPTTINSLSAWISRCQNTQRDIEIRFSWPPSNKISRGQKLKIAAKSDAFAAFERRVSADRTLLIAFLESLSWQAFAPQAHITAY